MEKRTLGRTGHATTVAVFGAGALSRVKQPVADKALELVIAAGVNHIDVAPSYGEAELRLRPWLAGHRDKFFLGCKTLERTRVGVEHELHASLKRLGTDHFDLYQFHAVNDLHILEELTAPGGALEAVLAARDAGLVRFIGITGHGLLAPTVFLEALRRFDFDSVMFPLNAVLFRNEPYHQESQLLLNRCNDQNIGALIIKTVARRPWGNQDHRYHTWYEPIDEPDQIQYAVNFVLSQPVTALVTPSDHRLLPLVLDACEGYSRLSDAEPQLRVSDSVKYEPIFSKSGRVGLD